MSGAASDGEGQGCRVLVLGTLGVVVAVGVLAGLFLLVSDLLDYESAEARQARLLMEDACQSDPCTEDCRLARRRWYMVHSGCAQDDRDCLEATEELDALHEALCR